MKKKLADVFRELDFFDVEFRNFSDEEEKYDKSDSE